MSVLSKRQKDIIKLLEEKDEYITIKNISEKFDVSPRTIRNDLDIIEGIISNYKINIDRRPRVGIKLILKPGQRIKFSEIEDYKIYSSEERIVVIVLTLIIKGKVTIEALAKELGISKNTLVQDLKSVVNMLNEYDIQVLKRTYYGISVNDDEGKIRNTFLNIYNMLSYELKEDIKERLLKEININSSYFKDKIDKIEVTVDNVYSQKYIEELEIILMLSECRYKNGYFIKYNDIDKQKLECTKEFKMLKEILNFNDYEIGYLLKIAVGLRNNIDYMINSITKEILNDFYKILEIDYMDDHEFNSQIAMHLKVAIHRIKNNLVIENPMLEEIKYKMQFIYQITEKILLDKEKVLGVKFPEEEIAYIAMYFDAIFERNIKFNMKYKILVVCNGGLATSSLLKTRINALLPEIEIVSVCRLRDLESAVKKYDIEFIISTVPIEANKYTAIVVNPLLDNNDIKKIKSEIYTKRYEKNSKYLINAIKKNGKREISTLLPEKYTQLDVDIDDWKEAIHLAAKPLLEDNKIANNYTREIIDIIESLGNYMVFVPKVAFVHATSENVIENSMSLLTLKSEINFGSKNKVPIKAIVVLANKKENMNLVDLLNIITNDNNLEKFKNASKYDDISSIH